MTLDEAIEVHRLTILYSGGGTYGSLELGKLESVLVNIENEFYYPTLADKLTHLFFCACKFHCFEDGNKRIALTLCVKYLLDNGYYDEAKNFITALENISYFVAAGKIDKDFLFEIISAYLDNNYTNNKALKIKLYKTIK